MPKSINVRRTEGSVPAKPVRPGSPLYHILEAVAEEICDSVVAESAAIGEPKCSRESATVNRNHDDRVDVLKE